jgi:aspartyl-tRNA(Asn)/glutamyl-tRNA(Gln) amidotransferase subunit A
VDDVVGSLTPPLRMALDGIPRSIRDIGRRFRDGSLSPLALVERLIARIAKHDKAIVSFHLVMEGAALAAAAKAEAELAAGRDRGPLHGIPYAVVDMIDVAGVPTRCGSRLTSGHIARESADVVNRFTQAGAVIVGKAATFEFATGGQGDGSLFPPTRNPWDLSRSPGANGAGAAIAAQFVPLAIGLDTGGAVRGSAALCGMVGLKPTFGLLSRQGVFPLSQSFDHVGLLAADVDGIAIGLAAADSRSPPPRVDGRSGYASPNLTQGVRDLTIGVVAGLPDLDASVTSAIEAAAAVLGAMGARITAVRLECYDELLAMGHTIYAAECYEIHEKDLRERPQLYGRLARERILLGASVRGSDYQRAKEARQRLTAFIDRDLFSGCDLLLMPSSPTSAPKLDAARYGAAPRIGAMTLPFNVTGHPALSIRCGTSRDGLPFGMQIVAASFKEATILRAAKAYETAVSGDDGPLF